MKIYNSFTFIIRFLTRKKSLVSKETDISCDFQSVFL